ncbi:MAG: S41 family peptidase [Verrucomicrobia bacterium]|nr:S41 family peptidase [Verrucomicrobiota bacterium]
MKKKILYGLLLTGLGVNLFLGAQIYFQSVSAAEKDDPYQHLKLFSLVLERVRQDYVDADKVAYQDLIQSALKGMLSHLDPHSEYMDTNKFLDLKKDTEGKFGGVGIVIAVKDGWITVVSPMEDTPGFKAGILSGDRIVRIDGRNAEKMSTPDAVNRLRGEPGTKVTLTILRPSTAMTKEYTLTREIINVPTVKDLNGHREFPLDEHKIGYIHLTQFGEQTTSDFEEALQKLKRQGMQALVLDLRTNPGGLLDQAVQIVEMFVPRNTLIVTTEGRGSTPKSEYRAKGGEKFSKLPLVVLVNGGSASASEIVSGALQDLTARGQCRAILVGEQTFGKGSVQSILPLMNGQALRLTTAKYYTPSHKVIHERGITPDITVPMSEEEERDLMLKRSPGVLESLEEEERQRVLNSTDPQLERAYDLLKGIAIYTQFTPTEAKPVKSGKVASK